MEYHRHAQWQTVFALNLDRLSRLAVDAIGQVIQCPPIALQGQGHEPIGGLIQACVDVSIARASQGSENSLLPTSRVFGVLIARGGASHN